MDEGISFGSWSLANGVTDPAEDDDSDGRENLEEYFFGTDPHHKDNGLLFVPTLSASVSNETRVSVTFTCNSRASDVSFQF